MYVFMPLAEPHVAHWSPRLVKAKLSTGPPPPMGKDSYSPSSGSHARRPLRKSGGGGGGGPSRAQCSVPHAPKSHECEPSWLVRIII